MGKNNRNRRRGPGKGPAQGPAQQPAQGSQAERYQKFLPAWMKDNASGQPVRPPRPRRARQSRPAGGYTPGKLAVHESRGEF
jgi:hypothetical protein